MFGTRARLAMTAALMLAFASLTGCRTVSGMRSAELTDGIPRAYVADYADVTEAAYQAVKSLGLTVEEVAQIEPNRWHVIATAGMSAFSWGELVRVSVQRNPAMPVSVWVLTRRRLATNITAKDDYAPEVFQKMDFRLRLRRPRLAPPPPVAPRGVESPSVTPIPTP
jgi:hypothetical protein